MSTIRRVLLGAILLLFVVLAYVIFNARSPSTDSGNVSVHPTTKKQPSQQSLSPNPHDVEHADMKGTSPVLPETLSASALTTMPNIAQLMQQAARTQDPASQAFAVYMPSLLCSSVLDLRNAGASTMKSLVPAKVSVPNDEAISRIAQRCADFLQNADSLRGALIRDLKYSKAPMAAFFASYRQESADPSAINEARVQLARVLDVQDATALQPLSLVWAIRNAEHFSAQLPESERPYAQSIASSAFDIAVCRAGGACGVGSVARDLICAKYAECSSGDVESAYKKLHEAVGMSFAETDRIANQLLDAIRRRDTIALWP